MTETVDEIIERGHSHIIHGEYKQAQNLANKLIQARQTDGFVLLADSLWASGNTQKAFTTISDAVQVAPLAWRLWETLGIYSSELENYEYADRAFEKAEQFAGDQAASVLLNWSVALERANRLEEALSKLEKIRDDNNIVPAEHYTALKASLLNRLERYSENLTLLNDALSQFSGEEEPQWLSQIYGELSYTKLILNKQDEAFSEAWKSIYYDKTNPTAAYVIREIENLRSEKSKYFILEIEGEWTHQMPENIEIPAWQVESKQFTVEYAVVADNLEEALKFAARFEPVELCGTLKILKSRELPNDDGAPKGVYEASSNYKSKD